MVPKGLLFLAVVILAFDVSSESHGLVTLGVPSLVHGSQSSLVHAVGSDPEMDVNWEPVLDGSRVWGVSS